MASLKSSVSMRSPFQADFERLREVARQAQAEPPVSIARKKETPPSGDKHDYLSYSRYWWPDPDSPNGLPYIRRDGVVNRKLVDRGDRNAIGGLVDNVVYLALANYFFEDEAAGKHARQLLDIWFLDEATRMNPNLNYAQAVPGRAEGRGVGIIDSRGFIWMLDAVELLRATGALDDKDMTGLKEWHTEFLDWLLNSPLAKEERGKANNHGSWFAAQAGRIAVFVDRHDVAKQIVNDVRDHRLSRQIGVDGSQPEELQRTQPFHYSLFNLAALTIVARVGDRMDVDLWSPRLGVATDFLAPYTIGQKPSPYKQIKKLKMSDVEHASLLIISKRYRSTSASGMAKSITISGNDVDLTNLQFPSLEYESN